MQTPQHLVAVSGLVRNAQGDILLVRSPKRGWEIPGGQVENGESLIEGLQREMVEEAGVTVEVGRLTGIYSNVKVPSKVIFCFLCDYVDGNLMPSPESIEVEWVAQAEVLGRITHPALFDRTQDALNFNGQVIYRVYETEPYRTWSVSWI